VYVKAYFRRAKARFEIGKLNEAKVCYLPNAFYILERLVSLIRFICIVVRFKRNSKTGASKCRGKEVT